MSSAETEFPFRNPDLAVDERVQDMISRMTLEEKVGQMLHDAPAIERLGIPSYNWWNECLHGVARAGVATVFPQAIGMAAAFSEETITRIGAVIAEEGRAKHHEFLREGERGYYTGLTFWTPNVNIFRDPRWGRGHETYGECPFLTGRLGVAFIRALQGDDETYLKAAATAKHYVVHSGPEGERHSFNAKVSEKDLRETYLPAFRDCVKEGKVESVMGAYNRTNGEVCCGSKRFLTEILREEFGFAGHVVSDCWAINDFHENHKITKNAAASAAMAVKNGCDLNCGCAFEKLLEAVEQGLLDEASIDKALTRLMSTRMRLGMFDPPERVPFASIPLEKNDCEDHRSLARDVARQSMVLLKNDGILPLSKDIPSISVVGPNGDDREVLLGNYAGSPSRSVTPLEGIREAVSEDTVVWSAKGCHVWQDPGNTCSKYHRPSEAVMVSRRADVIVACVGLNADYEGEGGDTGNPEASGDKPHLDLPGLQQPMLEALKATGKPLVVVVLSGSALALNWAHEHANAVIQAWYPGEEGGSALADILFGEVSPSGRLPISFVKTMDDLPDFRDYAMEGRTYRFQKALPLYPFGYGLSYTRFDYSDLSVSQPEIAKGETVAVEVSVTNSGDCAGDEVVQLYVRDVEASVRTPHHELRGFRRIHLEPGASERVRFELSSDALSLIDDDGQRVLEPGIFEIYVGGTQPDARSAELTGQTPLKTDIALTGERTVIPY
jgi:beta-glucosidase